MAIRPVVITGEPVLHQRARPVEVIDDQVRELVADMLETMDAARGVGLAAPQVGVGLRIFTWQLTNDDGIPPRGVVLNPYLTSSKPVVSPPAAEKPPPAKAVAVQEPKPQPAPKVTVSRTDAVPASSSLAEPPGTGHVLQVQAFPTRAAAEALAGRLKGKGYPAFVAINSANERGKYRVRVGKYATIREADAISRRLKQEEHFEPWRTH